MSIAAPSRRTRLLASAALASGIIVGASAATAVGAWNAPRQHGASETVPRIGIRFEPNVGQAPRRVAFVARGGDATLFLGRRGATLSRPGGAVRVGFAGALEADPEAAGRPAGTSSYFLGDDPAAWRSDVRASTRVAYPDLWPGVRMTFRGRANAVEYRFRVAPGADASAIGLTFGDATVHVADDGALRAGSPDSVTLRQSPAVLFQRVGDRRVPVSGRFVVRPGGEVGLAVGDYDRTVPLVVDPSIRLSTFFGGGGTDVAWAVDLGSNSTFMAGETRSLDFPTKAGAIDRTLGGSCDAFLVQLNVHKLDPVLNATYLGGGGCDRALGVDVGSNGAATLVGVTDSVDLPTTAGAYRSTYGGGAHDGWVAQVSPNGSSLTSATYLGGAGDDGAEDVAVDAGVAYVTGSTTSSDFPSTVGAPPGGGSDAFVTALNIPGSGLVFSRLAGGTADEAGTGIAVAAGGAASVAGWTDSPGFPTTAGVVQPAKAAGRDAFVMQTTPAGAVSSSTFLGGAGSDSGTSIALRGGVAFVGGTTTSANFPTTGGAYRMSAPGGPSDGFVTALAAGGTGLTWSTYVGGSGVDTVEGITADKKTNAYVVGSTSSADLPLSPGRFLDGLAGGTDAVLVMLRPTGAAAVIATYLGGSADDTARDVAVESMGEPVLAGSTASANFPTAQRPAQGSTGGGVDAFAASITTAKPIRVVLDDDGSTPPSITGSLDSTVQWEMPSSNSAWHSIVDANGTELFGSDALRPPGSTYSFRFLSGGVYAFEDGATGHAGTISIPDVAKPRTGTASTTFTVTWCAGQVPAWFVFDVQVQRPGSSAWSDLVGPGVTSASRKFVPDAGPGAYRFRSRVRSTLTGAATGWSPSTSIAVS